MIWDVSSLKLSRTLSGLKGGPALTKRVPEVLQNLSGPWFGGVEGDLCPWPAPSHSPRRRKLLHPFCWHRNTPGIRSNKFPRSREQGSWNSSHFSGQLEPFWERTNPTTGDLFLPIPVIGAGLIHLFPGSKQLLPDVPRGARGWIGAAGLAVREFSLPQIPTSALH